MAERIAKATRGARRAVRGEAGHLCNIEAPDLFNRTVIDFLRPPAR
jgi:hypothetical protein